MNLTGLLLEYKLNHQDVYLVHLPKFLSPLNSSNMNTPICIKPSRAEKREHIHRNS